MTKEEFNSLNTNDRAFTVEGYIDGFQAAIETVKSTLVRVGDPGVDRMFITNRDLIVTTLNAGLKCLVESEFTK